MIDLEFETMGKAEALRVLWGRVEVKIMMDAQVRIVEQVETKEH